MLQVRDLTVKAGGRPVIEGASFSVRAGDKVALVGRNGAGKTSLLQALAGEAPVAAGTVLRSDRVGYLRQEPLVRGGRDRAGDGGPTTVAYVLSGRGLDDAAERLERLRVGLEDRPTVRNIERYAGAEETFRAAGGYAAESEARRIAAG
ncbi:MAG TPA: ATP-binding cassette domain-containing protein, partial [Actinomycetota bacterium]|nr:ATP-binding cassette domain-containing protein [Actinomycetota bacterium]